MEKKNKKIPDRLKRKATIRKPVWFTNEEWEQIEKKMTSIGRKNFTKHVKELLLGVPPGSEKSHVKNENRYLYELNRIGVNLNQIAKKMNSDKYGPSFISTEDMKVIYLLQELFKKHL